MARTNNPSKNASPKLVYTAESALRRPGQLLSQMFKDIRSSRELAARLFIRDFSAQYRQSLLGVLWAFLPPLVTTSIFVYLNRMRVMSSGPANMSLPLFVFIGMLYWQLFVDCMQNPVKVVEGAKQLIAKLDFPRESLIMAAIGQALANFTVRLILLVGFCVWFGRGPELAGIPLMILAMAPVMLFGLAIGLVLLPAGLLFKDFQQGMTLGTTLIMFLTPVGYYVNANSSGPWHYKLNPLLYLINLPRDAFFGAPIEYGGVVALVTVISLLFLFAAWVVFRVSLPIVFERLGA